MIFPFVKVDSLVQIGDLFRIDLTGTTNHDSSEVDKVEIKPESTSDFVIVFEKETEKTRYFLDWMYESDGIKEISCKITSGSDIKEFSRSINCITESKDKLFSNDEMLTGLESDITNLLPAGRSSFKYAHRIAQEEIIRQLNELGYKVTPTKILNIKEVSWWSRYLTLELIFESAITSGQDIHETKRDTYKSKAESSKARVIITLDEDEDGEADGEISTFPTTLRRV